MCAAGVPRARALPAVDVSSSAQVEEIRDSLRARISAGLIPPSVLSLEEASLICKTDGCVMLRAARKEQRRAEIFVSHVPRLVAMLQEGQQGFKEPVMRCTVVTMFSGDEFKACAAATVATLDVERDMRKGPLALRDAHCAEGDAICALVLREVEKIEGVPMVSDVLRIITCKPKPDASVPWRQKTLGEDASAVKGPTQQAISAVYTLCILEYVGLPRNHFRIDGKILSFWEKCLRSVLTRDVEGFTPGQSANLLATIAAVYILERGNYGPHPDDPIQASSAEILDAVSCAFLEAYKRAYGLREGA